MIVAQVEYDRKILDNHRARILEGVVARFVTKNRLECAEGDIKRLSGHTVC